MELEVANNGYSTRNPRNSDVKSKKKTPLPGCAPPPFIGVLDIFPQISWREGLPQGDEGGGRVHNKGGAFLDSVHGRERRHQSWKSHRLARTVGQRRRSSGCAPR